VVNLHVLHDILNDCVYTCFTVTGDIIFFIDFSQYIILSLIFIKIYNNNKITKCD